MTVGVFRPWTVWSPVLLVAFAAGGCGSRGPGAANGGAPAPVNVVIFLIDTLRADRVGTYGYDRPTTPFLDELARHGVVFERAQAPAPWTLPSVPSIHTSTFPCEHGVTYDGRKIPRDLPTLAERLERLGYYNVSLYVNDWAGPATGMDRGFAVCRKPEGKYYVDGTDVEMELRRAPDRPFFLYVHNLEPHNPHNARPEFLRRFGRVPPRLQRAIGVLVRGRYNKLLKADWEARQPLGTTDNTAQQDAVLAQLHRVLKQHNILYDAVVREADSRVQSVVETLQRLGKWDNTLFVVLSDHGEEFADHGAYLHSQSVYQELTHVPLIVRFPRDEFAGTRVERVVSLLDVLPTILDYLGHGNSAEPARGKSLMPLVRGRVPMDDSPRVTTVRINWKKYYRPWASTRGNRNVAVMTPDGRWKCIFNVDLDRFELYDLQNDPHEQMNVCDQQPEVFARLAAFARRFYDECTAAARAAEQGEIGEEAIESLKALGYVGGEQSVTAEPPPEPLPPPRPYSGCPAP